MPALGWRCPWPHPAVRPTAGRIIAEPGAEGEVVEDGELRVLVVEEVERPERFVFRWATFDEPPSRVEIEIIESDGGSRVTITESPLAPMQMRADASTTLVGIGR